jgi:hypothetical protein
MLTRHGEQEPSNVKWNEKISKIEVIQEYAWNVKKTELRSWNGENCEETSAAVELSGHIAKPIRDFCGWHLSFCRDERNSLVFSGLLRSSILVISDLPPSL